MPRGDGTGPMGMGAMTGRAAGYCAGYAVPGFMNGVFGRGRGGFGRGFRGGWGQGRGFGWAAPVPFAEAEPTGSEIERLKMQAKQFGDALENINRRIAEIEAGKK